MAVFEVEQYELHSCKYRIEAATAAEAISKVFEGTETMVDNSDDYIEVAEDWGMPTAEHQDIADELRKLGQLHIRSIIPSIRSVEKVED